MGFWGPWLECLGGPEALLSHGQGCVPPQRGLRWANELVVFTWTGGVVLGGSPPCLQNQTSRPAAPFPFSFQRVEAAYAWYYLPPAQ